MGGKHSSILLHPDSEENVAKVFKDFDKDKSGVLDKEEWLKVAQLLWKEHEKFGINLGDFHDESTIQYFSTEIFKKVDINHDNAISFTEFWAFFRALENGSFEFGPGAEGNPDELITVSRYFDYVLPREEWLYCCQICHLPAEVPVNMIGASADQIFCRDCLILEFNLKAQFKTAEELPIVAADCAPFLDSMMVRCPFKWNGCMHVCPRNESLPHVGSCQFKRYKCPHATEGCPLSDPDIQVIRKHMDECGFRAEAVIGTHKPDKLCITCSLVHPPKKDGHPVHTKYHWGNFHGTSHKDMIQQQRAGEWIGTGAKDTLDFCGKVAVLSAKTFGYSSSLLSVLTRRHDAWVICKGSWHVSGVLVGWDRPRRHTSSSNNKGEGLVAIIAVGVGLVGSTGGLLIGAGHAIGTPFIELGKVIRSKVQPSWKDTSDCLVHWSCCSAGGSWAQGCRDCTKYQTES